MVVGEPIQYTPMELRWKAITSSKMGGSRELICQGDAAKGAGFQGAYMPGGCS